MNEIWPLMIAAKASSVLGMWALLFGSSGAMLFPDLVRFDGLFADSFVDRGTVRLIAAPLMLASSVLLSDHYYSWTKGLF